MVRFHADFSGSDNKLQEADFTNSELNLLGIAIEAEFPELLQHMARMVLLLLLVCQIDQYVIKIACYEVVNAWPYAIINITLECSLGSW